MTTLLDQAICARTQGSDRVLVVGIGDDTRGDDGIGPQVIRQLCDRASARPFVIQPGTAEQLRAQWGRADLVVMVLAARHASDQPGSVYSLTTVLGRTRRPDGRLSGFPSQVVVHTVEGADFTAGAGLSAEVERTAHRLVEHIAMWISTVTPSDGATLRRPETGAAPETVFRAAG